MKFKTRLFIPLVMVFALSFVFSSTDPSVPKMSSDENLHNHEIIDASEIEPNHAGHASHNHSSLRELSSRFGIDVLAHHAGPVLVEASTGAVVYATASSAAALATADVTVGPSGANSFQPASV